MKTLTFNELGERARAFQESRALLTAIELDLFTAVGSGGGAAQIAARLRSDPRATEMLLNALVAIGALRKRGERFLNTAHTAKYLDNSSPDSQRDGLLHTVNLWDKWSTLTDCVRAGMAVALNRPEERGGNWVEAFIAAMHNNAAARAPALVKAVGARRVRRLLDAGGGSGAYSIAFARANPHLRALILDRPAVLPIARRHIRRAGLSGRVRTKAGDLRTDVFGKGFDLVLLSAICHMLSPADNLDLLRRAQRALVPGGRVVIRDFLLDAGKTSPRRAALFSLNMLVNTQGGASYSEAEYRSWLEDAGFSDIRRLDLPDPASGLMIGSRPSA